MTMCEHTRNITYMLGELVQARRIVCLKLCARSEIFLKSHEFESVTENTRYVTNAFTEFIAWYTRHPQQTHLQLVHFGELVLELLLETPQLYNHSITSRTPQRLHNLVSAPGLAGGQCAVSWGCGVGRVGGSACSA